MKGHDRVRLRNYKGTYLAVFRDTFGRKVVLDLGVSKEEEANILLKAVNADGMILAKALGRLKQEVFEALSGGPITLRSAFDDFIKFSKTEYPPLTHGRNRTDVNLFIQFHDAWEAHPCTVTRMMVSNWANQLVLDGLKINSIKAYISSLSRFFEWCRDRGYVSSEPTRKITRSLIRKVSNDKLTVNHKDPITQEELDRFLAEIVEVRRTVPAFNRSGNRSREWCILTFLHVASQITFETGIRMADAVRLSWDDLDGKVLRVSPSKTKGKSNNLLTFVLSNHIMGILERYGRVMGREGFMFDSVRRCYEKSNRALIYAIFSDVWDRCGFERKKSYHSLRAGCATHTLLKELHQSEILKKICTHLGHSSVSTTLAYIAHAGKAQSNYGFDRKEPESSGEIVGEYASEYGT